MLGDGLAVGPGSVCDQDAATPGRSQVDRLYADPVARDHLEAGSQGEQLLGHGATPAT